jgi:biofilm PGA synthesis protein PgaD
MDKSGPWHHPTLNSPIIERPDLQSPRQRTLYGAITLAFWAIWIYLWVPLLALFAWLLGFEEAYRYMVVYQGYREVQHVLENYALIVVIMGGTLLAWASYNITRFRGADKRSARPGVSHADISRDLDHDEESVLRWQKERMLLVRYDDAGRMTEVRGSGV